MASKLPAQLFWLEWVQKIIWDPFWWVVFMLFIFWVPFLRVWWWLFFPLFLSMQLKTLYLWWVNWDFDYAKVKWKVLEIIPPKEVLTPLKAMEDVFTTIWGPIYDVANWRERWCDGELNNAPYWLSWEIASIEGQIHFYVRVMAQHRTAVETAIYGYYPEIEINEVSDYTKLVPQNIPNEEWDIYGEDFELAKPAAYPIRTYEKFFEPQGEKISAEEKRIDPITSLLELLSKLGQGEHFWLQFIIMSITDYDDPWRKRAEKEITKIAKRPEKKETTLFEDLWYVAKQVILGPEKEGSGEKATYEWVSPSKSEEGEREMVITPGEREIVTEIENKIKKPVFRTAMRGVYVAKRENWKPSHRIITRSYFAHFMTQNLNRLSFSGKTRPRIHYIWRQRRVFLRARRMFKNSVLRFPSLFPDRQSICAILSTEEMATLFHFPVKITGLVAPTMARVESKKGGPPPNLPVE